MEWRAPDVVRGVGLADLATAGERGMLEGWLRWHRETLLRECAGLGAERLARAAVEPSNLSLLGLVRHMAEVERWWFRRDFARYRAETAARDAAVAGHSLDETLTSARGTVLSLRWVHVLMIQEYARHNGHADLLRERTDGTTGD
ncbi:DUF664 domain-containing protein [Streptacidiphilus sp. P02-A3a]|uniref:mycothiol transferase n=1 Tax=Streptacidiphilus sp. P02-A3a TaxID=2704468 RepID=UPI0015FD400F|nr:DUF664 domain-containing protein [Streptacidiphilus sp. P02-A3a]QMU70517.1 DUF664 domain-containing protein [Streptacidiphilus sp. P02-A3a]